MSQIVVVIDQHGGGQLVGVFDDPRKIELLKKTVKKSGEEGYVFFTKAKLNKANLTTSGFLKNATKAEREYLTDL